MRKGQIAKAVFSKFLFGYPSPRITRKVSKWAIWTFIERF